MVIPFSLLNILATFQAYINRVLASLVNIFCIIYLNDILIYSKTSEKHTIHLQKDNGVIKTVYSIYIIKNK